MAQEPPIPRGIEILLKKAAASTTFRSKLLLDPAAAAAEIDLELTATERSVLEQTTKQSLEHMIDAVKIVPSQRDAVRDADAAAIRAMLPPIAHPSPTSHPPPTGIAPDRVPPRPAAPVRIIEQERCDPSPHRHLVTGIAPDRPPRPWWKRLLGR